MRMLCHRLVLAGLACLLTRPATVGAQAIEEFSVFFASFDPSTGDDTLVSQASVTMPDGGSWTFAEIPSVPPPVPTSGVEFEVVTTTTSITITLTTDPTSSTSFDETMYIFAPGNTITSATVTTPPSLPSNIALEVLPEGTIREFNVGLPFPVGSEFVDGAVEISFSGVQASTASGIPPTIEISIQFSGSPPTPPATPPPTVSPTMPPTLLPTLNPDTFPPSPNPTQTPGTTPPTQNPTENPGTTPPTQNPTENPGTTLPTASPTSRPTESPVLITTAPTPTGSLPPTTAPTQQPSPMSITVAPTPDGTLEPTDPPLPTVPPTFVPTRQPILPETPTALPTPSPTDTPVTDTNTPTASPTLAPTLDPTQSPTVEEDAQDPLIRPLHNGFASRPKFNRKKKKRMGRGYGKFSH